jgi:tetratricopeptide (TPR) repeat protein
VGGNTYNYYDTDVMAQPAYPVASQYAPVDPNAYADPNTYSQPQQQQQAPQQQQVQPQQTGMAPSDATLAMQAFYRGDYETARREFIRAIVASPDDPELLMMYGFAHFATGDYLVATLAIRRAIKDDPTLIESPVDILGLYASEDQFNAQVARLDDALRQNDQDVDARFLAGFVRYAAGRAGEAQNYFAGCAAFAPQEPTNLLMRDAAMRAASRPAQPSGSATSGIAPAADAEYMEMTPVTPS